MEYRIPHRSSKLSLYPQICWSDRCVVHCCLLDIQDSALRSKPRPSPHKFSTWPQCAVLTGGIQDSALRSKPRPSPHKPSTWPPMWHVVDWVLSVHSDSSLVQHPNVCYFSHLIAAEVSCRQCVCAPLFECFAQNPFILSCEEDMVIKLHVFLLLFFLFFFSFFWSINCNAPLGWSAQVTGSLE